jgi:peptidyl-prolyl cis-trans isomerase SurA
MRMRNDKIELGMTTRHCVLLALACVLFSVFAQPRMTHAQAPAEGAQVESLDSVIAVVNKQVILASDLDLEMRIYRLLPIGERDDFTPGRALDRLTARALIEQQIAQEDPHGLEIAPADLTAALTELRQSLPGCKQRDCASAKGWAAYLAALGLTPERVAEYWTHRMAMLRFIELRFRSGNRVAPEEIQKYYRDEFVPKYARPADAPALERISPRIEEILLQQKVNALLADWLKSLQDQGQVEILDPSLRAQPAIEPASPVATPEKGGKP